MTTITLSGRELNQNVGRAKGATKTGPVYHLARQTRARAAPSSRNTSASWMVNTACWTPF